MVNENNEKENIVWIGSWVFVCVFVVYVYMYLMEGLEFNVENGGFVWGGWSGIVVFGGGWIVEGVVYCIGVGIRIRVKRKEGEVWVLGIVVV